jgi:ferric-dicitrate binding protein FerR (iron transport regulator)
MDMKQELLSQDAIDDAAMDWVLAFDARCYGNSPPAPEVWAQFDAWLKADPRHALAYQAMKDFKDGIHQRLNPWPEAQQS